MSEQARKLGRAAKLLNQLDAVQNHKAKLEAAYADQPHPDIKDLIVEKGDIERELKRELQALGHTPE